MKYIVSLSKAVQSLRDFSYFGTFSLKHKKVYVCTSLGSFSDIMTSIYISGLRLSDDNLSLYFIRQRKVTNIAQENDN